MEKEYQPIACDFYDRIEAAIVLQNPVRLKYQSLDGKLDIATLLLKDTKTDTGKEYVLLEDGRWLRMDLIVSLNEKEAG